MDEMILKLDEINPRHQLYFGSKAANLGVIARNCQTAPGFCLSSRVYYNALRSAGVLKEVIKVACKAEGGSIDTITAASRRIKEIIKGVNLPENVEQMLEAAFRQLMGEGEGIKVAVRSSATAEDLPSASFAGQLESFLNIQSFEKVKEAVINCWCSLWEPRVIHYRFQKGIEQANSGMAVIIQEMVPAEVAGVMFTANPLNNSREEICIEAVKGLGEGLVQGTTSGDRYLVKKDGLYITHREMVGGSPYLTDFHIRWLADEGAKLEALFDAPQDIEWAYNWGDIYILQARPITTLADEEAEIPDPEDMTVIQREVWTTINERFPEPVLPLDSVIVKTYFLSLFLAYKDLGFSVPLVDWNRVEKGVFPDFFVPPAIRMGPKRLIKIFKMVRLDIAKEWQINENIFNKYLDLLKRDTLKTFPMEVIHQYLEEALKDFQRANMFRYLMYIQYGTIYGALSKLLSFLYGDEGKELFQDVIIGHPQITMELNVRLEELAGEINKNPQAAGIVIKQETDEIEACLREVPAGEKAIEEFNSFLEKYGSREVSQGLGGVAADTWQERPEVVWGMLKGVLLQQDGVVDYHQRQLERRERAEKRLAQLTSRGAGRVLPLKRWIDRLVVYARKYTAFREDSHFYLTQVMPVFRSLFLEIGRQLVSRGVLKDKQEVMYFNYWELVELLDDVYNYKKVSPKEIKETLAERKANLERRRKLWLSRNLVVEGDNASILNGIGASSGKASGICRVVLDPRDLSKLKPGDILVAQYTNPSWTPVFSFIDGLVVEYGSALSHAAIIAREYGVPAVMGVKGVTRLIKDGDRITIDGSQGLVHQEGK
ncbi:hypothetical protein MFMK1_001410 [Metallumcola ferriviriculae]|uniref:Phosphoenolpyruvate synthase n=1 Tax=Metallumcola ferriviriculae TaxID=3039180 RepID=A0AAU0UMS6_9FIRM|nr:hypothetical protein MFMK1_001410 [Desulfitibacteraceae bacterium MK1]